MSDIREHISCDIASRLLYMAQRAAFQTEERHAYLPSGHWTNAEKFVPHHWVLDAMSCAYAAGHSEDQDHARERMRRAMGLQSGNKIVTSVINGVTYSKRVVDEYAKAGNDKSLPRWPFPTSSPKTLYDETSPIGTKRQSEDNNTESKENGNS